MVFTSYPNTAHSLPVTFLIFETAAAGAGIVAAEVPGNATLVILDHLVIGDGDEAVVGLLKIPLIGQGQNLSLVLLGLDGELRRWFALGVEMRLIVT
jgi:hypothetical protein